MVHPIRLLSIPHGAAPSAPDLEDRESNDGPYAPEGIDPNSMDGPAAPSAPPHAPLTIVQPPAAPTAPPLAQHRPTTITNAELIRPASLPEPVGFRSRWQKFDHPCQPSKPGLLSEYPGFLPLHLPQYWLNMPPKSPSRPAGSPSSSVQSDFPRKPGSQPKSDELPSLWKKPILRPFTPPALPLVQHPASTITDAQLATLATRYPDMQSLSLRGCKLITDDGLQSLTAHCPDLRNLDLSGCDRITDAGLEGLGFHCPNLKDLGLYGCKLITDAGLAKLMDYCPNLSILN